MYFSTSTVALPNDLADSRWAEVSASAKSLEELTIRMPLPPPP